MARASYSAAVPASVADVYFRSILATLRQHLATRPEPLRMVIRSFESLTGSMDCLNGDSMFDVAALIQVCVAVAVCVCVCV